MQKSRVEPNTTIMDAKHRGQNLSGDSADGIKDEGQKSRREYSNGIGQRGPHTKAEKRKS